MRSGGISSLAVLVAALGCGPSSSSTVKNEEGTGKGGTTKTEAVGGVQGGNGILALEIDLRDASGKKLTITRAHGWFLDDSGPRRFDDKVEDGWMFVDVRGAPFAHARPGLEYDYWHNFKFEVLEGPAGMVQLGKTSGFIDKAIGLGRRHPAIDLIRYSGSLPRDVRAEWFPSSAKAAKAYAKRFPNTPWATRLTAAASSNTARQVQPSLAGGGVVKALDGDKIEINDLYSSNVAVIMFYRGHWCNHCRRQLRALQTIHANLKQKKVRLVAISTDDAEASQRLKKRLGLGFDLLSDPSGEAIRIWDVWSAQHEIAHPSTFVVARGGTLVYSYVGKNPRDQAAVADIQAAVDVATK